MLNILFALIVISLAVTFGVWIKWEIDTAINDKIQRQKNCKLARGRYILAREKVDSGFQKTEKSERAYAELETLLANVMDEYERFLILTGSPRDYRFEREHEARILDCRRALGEN